MYIKKEVKDLNCDYCGGHYKSNYLKSRFCSSICRHNFWNKNIGKDQTVISEYISRSTVGAISELMVCIDLMKKGYSVYKAISPNCFSDLIAIKNEKVFQMEVKTGRYTKTNKINYPNGNTAGKSIVVYTYRDNKIHYITNPELS